MEGGVRVGETRWCDEPSRCSNRQEGSGGMNDGDSQVLAVANAVRGWMVGW